LKFTWISRCGRCLRRPAATPARPRAEHQRQPDRRLAEASSRENFKADRRVHHSCCRARPMMSAGRLKAARMKRRKQQRKDHQNVFRDPQTCAPCNVCTKRRVTIDQLGSQRPLGWDQQQHEIPTAIWTKRFCGVLARQISEQIRPAPRTTMLMNRRCSTRCGRTGPQQRKKAKSCKPERINTNSCGPRERDAATATAR